MELAVNMLRATQILRIIEELPEDAIGALRFRDSGAVLIDSRRICWAIATDMPQRLTDLLRLQRNPPLARSFIAQVLRQAHEAGRPMGEALLATGQITESGLRAALLGQVTAAIAHLSRSATDDYDFEPYDGVRYDARFLFAPAAIFAGLGAVANRVDAAVARRRLVEWLDPGTPALVFSCEASSRVPTVLAISNADSFTLGDMLDIGARIRPLCRGAQPVAPMRTTGWRDNERVLAWTHRDLSFAAICAQERTAKLLAGLSQRFGLPVEVCE